MASDGARALEPVRYLGASAAVGPRSARLWFRTPDDHATVRVLSADGHVLGSLPLERARAFGDRTYVVEYPTDVPDGAPLEPLTRYRYELIDAGDRALVQGRFETAPERGQPEPERFAIAVASCHQPMNGEGNLEPKAMSMLQALPEVLEREHVKRVLLVGDQMYTDAPEGRSLFETEHFRSVAPPGRSSILECTADEVRTILHERYRRAWSASLFDRIQRDWPCYMIWDDHELMDNWGSKPEHATESFRAFKEGALAACRDYEMARVLDRSEGPFCYGLDYGSIATFVMDLRSQKETRDGTTQMYGPDQLQALRRFLSERSDAAVVMLVLSLPLFHLPDWVGKLGAKVFPEGNDLSDRWSADQCRASRDALVGVLKEHKRAHPDQLLVLLGGDVHVSLSTRLSWSDAPGTFYQLTASPLSNTQGLLKPMLASLLSRLKPVAESDGEGTIANVELLEGTGDSDENPLADLNVGILAFTRSAGGLELTFKLYSHDADHPGRPRLAFCSRPVALPLRPASGRGRAGL